MTTTFNEPVVPRDVERRLLQQWFDSNPHGDTGYEDGDVPFISDDDFDEDDDSIGDDSDTGLVGDFEKEFIAALSDEWFERKATGGPMDVSPLGEGDNWVTHVGGLPLYIRAIAHALIRGGHDESEAVELAIGAVERWSHGGDGVTPETVAKAQAALAELDRKRAESHAMSAGHKGWPTQNHEYGDDYYDGEDDDDDDETVTGTGEVARRRRLRLLDDDEDDDKSWDDDDLEFKAGFNPKEARDPHTGRWIEGTPGLMHMLNGDTRYGKIGKYTGHRGGNDQYEFHWGRNKAIVNDMSFEPQQTAHQRIARDVEYSRRYTQQGPGYDRVVHENQKRVSFMLAQNRIDEAHYWNEELKKSVHRADQATEKRQWERENRAPVQVDQRAERESAAQRAKARRADLAAAQEHARRGEHDKARELFARHGINYEPAKEPLANAHVRRVSTEAGARRHKAPIGSVITTAHNPIRQPGGTRATRPTSDIVNDPNALHQVYREVFDSFSFHKDDIPDGGMQLDNTTVSKDDLLAMLKKLVAKRLLTRERGDHEQGVYWQAVQNYDDISPEEADKLFDSKVPGRHKLGSPNTTRVQQIQDTINATMAKLPRAKTAGLEGFGQVEAEAVAARHNARIASGKEERSKLKKPAAKKVPIKKTPAVKAPASKLTHIEKLKPTDRVRNAPHVDGWDRYRGKDGETYYVGKDPEIRGQWIVTNHRDDVLFEGKNKDELLRSLNGHAKRGTTKDMHEPLTIAERAAMVACKVDHPRYLSYEQKYTPRTCKHPDCNDTPTKGVLWAEGMGMIPVCDHHEQWARDIIENENNDEVVGVRPIKQ